MAQLENPAENVCYGCGPSNGRGLHLAFERVTAEGGVDEVRTMFVAEKDQTGWPGLLHTGLHFTVLYEVSYWAALTIAGRVMVSRGPVTFDQVRLPRVGERCVATAVRIESSSTRMRIRAVTANERGRECAVLLSEWEAVTREQVERWGIALPAYLLEDVEG